MHESEALWVLDLAIREHTQLGEVSSYILSRDIAIKELIVNISFTTKCPMSCRQLRLHVAYNEPFRYGTVILKWEVHLVEHWQVVRVSQLPAPNSTWLLYITHTSNDTSCFGKCLTNIASSQALFPNTEHYTLNTSSTSSSFAQYTLLWTSGDYSWYEAENTCTQIGMHLASIASEEEYELVRGMIYGDAYLTGSASQHDLRILTPCRIAHFICVIHIGLQVEVYFTVHVHI